MMQTSSTMPAATTLKSSPSMAARSLRCPPTTATPRVGAAPLSAPKRTVVLLAPTSGSTLLSRSTQRTPTMTRLWVKARVLRARCQQRTVVLRGLLLKLRFLSSLLVSLRAWLRNRFPRYVLMCGIPPHDVAGDRRFSFFSLRVDIFLGPNNLYTLFPKTQEKIDLSNSV